MLSHLLEERTMKVPKVVSWIACSAMVLVLVFLVTGCSPKKTKTKPPKRGDEKIRQPTTEPTTEPTAEPTKEPDDETGERNDDRACPTRGGAACAAHDRTHQGTGDRK